MRSHWFSSHPMRSIFMQFSWKIFPSPCLLCQLCVTDQLSESKRRPKHIFFFDFNEPRNEVSTHEFMLCFEFSMVRNWDSKPYYFRKKSDRSEINGHLLYPKLIAWFHNPFWGHITNLSQNKGRIFICSLANMIFCQYSCKFMTKKLCLMK